MTVPPPAAVTRAAVGSASVRVLEQVAGSRRPARVLHTGRDAAYLDDGGSCLALLAARAVPLPCGVRTPLPVLPVLAPGGAAVVGGGWVEVTATDGSRLEVAVTGIVDTTVPVVSHELAARAGQRLAELAGDRLDDVRTLLPAGPLSRLAAADPGAVESLLGLGPGLTPVGDDVLAGWLAAAVAARHPGLPAVRTAVEAAAPTRTTTLSATLLACAARGEAVPSFRDLLTGLVRDDPTLTARSLDAMMAIGDTSGRGLVLGAVSALRPPCPSTLTEGAA